MYRIAGAFDLPDGVEPLMGRELVVWGWAHSMGDPVARVEIRLDGEPLGYAGLCRPRPDVAVALSDPQALLAGFELRAPVPWALRDGRRTRVDARATTISGETFDLAPVDVTIAPAAPPDESQMQPPRLARAPEHRRPSGDGGRLRILWCARGLDPGGSQMRMAELLGYVAGSGRYDNTVVSPADGPL
ncbi:MAG TPA: hypothetical protein VGS21_12455, partial [Acidimicrobiales bacterium]|nr:hypothetical protein [Acidimicrobiales bacterium]